MLGRSPDFLNVNLAAFASAAEYFAQADPRFGRNVVRYYEYVRDHDLSLTHTLITPQVNRSKGPHEQADPYIVAGVVEERDDGIVIRGARMLATLAPFSDELAVFPSTVLQNAPGAERYAYAFAIPCDTPGLKMICRESFDAGGSRFDHPLATGFEEMDALVVFDDVLVPWERVFLYNSVELVNGLFRETGAILHLMHQFTTRMLAKAEFVLGVGILLAETIAVDGFPQVQERLAEIVNDVEIVRACIDSAERNAQPGPGGTVVPAAEPLWSIRTTFYQMYSRMLAHLQQLGAGGLMLLPTEKDLASPIGPDVRRYYQAANAGAEDRIRLFRLAWDIVGSTWGGRQELYERFFSGDPVRLMSARYLSYNKAPYRERVRGFLERAAREAPPSQP
jgi:4-hydroxyphenylacetate 3-monooxygenase